MIHHLRERPYLCFEFFVLCMVTPAIIIINTWAALMFNFLYGAALYGFIVLILLNTPLWAELRGGKVRSVKRFNEIVMPWLREMWKWEAVTWANMKPVLIRWVLACIAMTVFIYFYDPGRMFGLMERAPLFIPFLMIAYPVLSALPQELVFCSFFFQRYKAFFGEGMMMVWASAIIFAYAHVLYINPVAPTLSLFGGLIFALTYLRTKSLALVTIEHGLYGNYLFIVGLGYYFYGGAVVSN